jgi:phenylacetic acid degradation operon negative regulatory protein
MEHVDYGEILDLFCALGDVLSRPTLYRLLEGYDEYAEQQRAHRLIQRLQQQKLISRTGKRRDAFTITADGHTRRPTPNPTAAWRRSWDGAWRVLTFDLPEVRRKDRKRLWQALRAHKLGLLQRSVWIWPHELQPILREIMEVEGLPECFCGFNATSLFLCTTAEIVITAWDWEEIERHHRRYLQHLVANERSLQAARDIPALATVARIERRAYEDAFIFDPLLPRSLWPPDYNGDVVQTRHESFRRLLRQRFHHLNSAR